MTTDPTRGPWPAPKPPTRSLAWPAPPAVQTGGWQYDPSWPDPKPLPPVDDPYWGSDHGPRPADDDLWEQGEPRITPNGKGPTFREVLERARVLAAKANAGNQPGHWRSRLGVLWGQKAEPRVKLNDKRSGHNAACRKKLGGRNPGFIRTKGCPGCKKLGTKPKGKR